MKKWIVLAISSAAFCIVGLIFCASLILQGAALPFAGGAAQPEISGSAADSQESVNTDSSVSSSVDAPAISRITAEQAALLPQNPADFSRSVWAVDWDEDSAKAYLDAHQDEISEVSIFAATFNSAGQISEPDALTSLMQDLKAAYPDKEYYLSVTNDIIEGGWAEAKNSDILYTLLEDENSARAHAQQLAALAEDQGFDGVEIDYESIYGDTRLWNLVIRFEDMLAEEAGSRGLGVRVVLEPSIPADQLNFSDQVEHVVMCYDAHGIGTDAGPRADFEFLSGIVSNFSQVPNLSYAIANGGYDWNLGSGYTEPCSDRDVAKMMETYGGESARDESNGALLYSYTDEAGSAHQLWYGDEETLRIWQTQIENQVGHPVSVCVWRA